jgi:hypothetical protein
MRYRALLAVLCGIDIPPPPGREGRQVGPEVRPTSAFYSCTPTGVHGPGCIVWANVAPSLAFSQVRKLLWKTFCKTPCPGRRGRLSVSVFLCKSVLYGALVWARRGLRHRTRRVSARAVHVVYPAVDAEAAHPQPYVRPLSYVRPLLGAPIYHAFGLIWCRTIYFD